MEEWQEAEVQRWESERRSRPTAVEMENWERTVAEIKVRYKLVEDGKDRAALCHRLATAYVKMEDYQQAMVWADKGLEETAEGWKRELLEDKALILYLEGKQAEAMSVLNGLGPRSRPAPIARSPGRSMPAPTKEAVLNLVCPHCSAEIAYGQIRCTNCEAKVDDSFKLVRSTNEGKMTMSINEAPRHNTKSFSIFLTVFTVDYDDPMNFLTAHRVRFMGGEMVTITERDWFVKMNLLLLAFFYGVLGLLIWKAATVLDATAGPLAFSIIMAIVYLLPYSLFYLYVVFPNFLGGTCEAPLPDD